MSAFIMGIVGAESTGKTVLAAGLSSALSKEFDCLRVSLVGEYLREFCELHGRTPLQCEQRGIALEQARRIEEAAAGSDIVIADTTAVMIAVYSEIVFGDTTLYAMAEAAHRRCDLTLLTALDLPWQADGLQRDGPHVREPVDALARASLTRAGVAYSVVSGAGDARLAAALAAARFGMRRAAQTDATGSAGPAATTARRWSTPCERCGDADCERRLLGY